MSGGHLDSEILRTKIFDRFFGQSALDFHGGDVGTGHRSPQVDNRALNMIVFAGMIFRYEEHFI